MYAIRVLQAHEMLLLALQQVFRAVVISKLTHSMPLRLGGALPHPLTASVLMLFFVV